MTSLHQSAFRGGATHVERDHALNSEFAGVYAGADATADRPRFHQRDRLLAGAARRQDAAVRRHDQELRVAPLLLQLVLEPADIAGCKRSDIGVRDRCRGPFIFEPFARMFDADRDIYPRQPLADQRRRLDLVSRIDIGVEKRDGDRLDLVLLNTRAQPVNLFDVKRDQNRALRIDVFLPPRAADCAESSGGSRR